MTLQEAVDQAYQEGRDAYWSGKKSEDNPYNGVNEDYQWEAWKEGYYREILIKKAYDSLYPAFIPWEEQCLDIQNRNHQIMMECARYAVDVFLARCKEENK